MTARICFRAALVVVALGLLLSGCTSPVGTNGGADDGAEPIPPPDKIVGAFAFADEAGTIELEFPGTKGSPKAVAPKALHAVTGTLTVEVGGDSYQLDIAGDYDDENGEVEATASGEIAGEETTYSIVGKYIPGIGFEGEITRSKGSATATGVVGALALEGVSGLQFYVFLGSYAVTTDWEVYDDENNLVSSGSTGEIDPFGTFCITCSSDPEQWMLGVCRNDPSIDDSSAHFAGKFTTWEPTWDEDDSEWEFEIYVEDGEGQGILSKVDPSDPSTWTLTGSFDTEWTEDDSGYRIEITQHGTFEAAAQ